MPRREPALHPRSPLDGVALAPLAPQVVPREESRANSAPDFGEKMFSMQPRMVAVAMRITRDAEAASDVVQAAFEKALRKADQFRGDALLSTWLHRIVVNEALMWLRGERRRTERFTPVADPAVFATTSLRAPADDQMAAGEDEIRVRRALARLRPEERDLLECCGLEDESYRAYGQRRGLHPAAVKSRAFRARKQMRALLEASG